MNQEADDDNDNRDIDEDELLAQLEKTVEEIEGDKKRLNKILRSNGFKDDALAGEIVQTILPTVSDVTSALTELMISHKDALDQIDDVMNQQRPRAFDMLVKALVEKNVLDAAYGAQIMEVVTTGSPQQSILSALDGGQILDMLLAYKLILEKQSNGEPSTPLRTLQGVITRVQEITDGIEPPEETDEPASEQSPIALPPPAEADAEENA